MIRMHYEVMYAVGPRDAWRGTIKRKPETKCRVFFIKYKDGLELCN